MKRIIAVLAAIAGTTAISSPSYARYTHTHYCDCGHTSGSSQCGSSSGGTTTTTGGTTTGGTTTTTGGTTTTTTGGAVTTTGGTTTSGGTTTGGTQVPEPGMLGILALGLTGVGIARFRRRR